MSGGLTLNGHPSAQADVGRETARPRTRKGTATPVRAGQPHRHQGACWSGGIGAGTADGPLTIR